MKNKKKKISNNSKILWKILNLEQKRWFIVISFMMIIGMILEMIGIGLVIPAIAILMSPDQLDNFPFVKSISLLIIGNKEIGKEFIILSGLMLFLFFYLFKTIYLTFLTWTQAVYSSSIQRSVAKEVFTKYMKQDYMFHLERNSAQLIQNVNGEVSLFSIAVQSKLTLITEALVLFGISILLIVVQPMGTIAMVFILITFSFLYYFSTKKFVSKLGKERQIHEGLKIQHLQQGLGGIKDVKITGREKLFIDSFNFHNVIHAKIIALITTIISIPRIWLDFLAVTAVVTLVFVNIKIGNSLEIIIPSIGLFIAAGFRILPSGNKILLSIQNLNFTRSAISKIYDEMKLFEPTILPNNKQINFNNLIELKDVSFRYNKNKKSAINNFSISIKKGDFIGIIGHSGSGKTTLLDLLLGFLEPDHGFIKVDDQEIKLNLKNWRQKLGYVPQDIFITDSSIKENIAFGLPIEKIDNKKLTRAIKMAQIEEFINELPNKLDTKLGERGVRISGGQKQRIGIARALYSDPEILILDEATSSLDTQTEKEVMNSILKLKRKKTIIVVAHRTSTLLKCDRVIELPKKISSENFNKTN